MKCLDCECQLVVTHTYKALGHSAKTQRSVCSGCGKVYTSLVLLRAVNGRGRGAKATAEGIKTAAAMGFLREVFPSDWVPGSTVAEVEAPPVD